MEYEVVIGLEVHCELNTATKIFCGCKNGTSDIPNAHTCPGCLGMPGTLPVMNKQAIKSAIKAGLALNCEIAKFCKWDRKSYFYPDLPNAYQISQLDKPICIGGHLTYNVEGIEKTVRLNRIHLEEDAGKLVHSEFSDNSLVDLNRVGVPLIEIVTEPDIRSAEEAIGFLENLKSILEYTKVSDCKMEKGNLRCDVNISVMPKGSTKFGVRTEMKNINSFKAVNRAILYETKRHIKCVESGELLIQETRRWDDAQGKSFSMRSKENAQDYRYFPDPNLVPVILTDSDVEEIRKTLPMLPRERRAKYVSEYNLPEYDAEILTTDIAIAEFFDECLKSFNDAKTLSNWVMGDIMRKIKDEKSEDVVIKITPNNFVSLLNMFKSNTISQTAAKQVFEDMWGSDKTAQQVVAEKGLGQINDTSELEKLVKEMIINNPKPVEDYKSGNTKAMAFFVGQLMKATKGKANPQILNELLVKELER